MTRAVLEDGRRLRRRLTAAIIATVAVALLISNTVGLYLYREREVAAARQNLVELLNLMDAQSYYTDAEELLGQFHTAAPDKRLTLITAEGQVLGDTDVEDLETNHADRPEVVAAMEDGWGEATRHSETTGQTMLYVAKIFTDGNVGRASMPLSSVNALVVPGILGFLAAAAAALILSWLLARRVAGQTAKPVEEAQEAVAQVDETLQSARSEFTANVTHELKTPLTSIKGFVEMMASGLVRPEDQKGCITMISVEVDRLISLIDDILQLSELEVVGATRPGEQTDVMAVVRDVAEFLQPAAAKVQVELTTGGLPCQAAISPGRLREVVLNLVENAVKYNRPGGTVTVGASCQEGWCILTVADTGIGIPEDSQGRVFERFYRVDKGRSRAQGGTGLGLAIVKHIVALYGGSITLTSTLGEGTTIVVKLPAAGSGPEET